MFEASIYIYAAISIYIYVDVSRKMESQVIFFNPCTVCLLCKQKFVVCLFVDKETNRSCPFANGLNGNASYAFIVCNKP